MTAPAALSQPADARSVEILDRVRHAFAEKGFDGASMQDLARAAGMSVGNFYRYFPSKAAIVEGLIHRDLSEIEATFAAVMGLTFLSTVPPTAGLVAKFRKALAALEKAGLADFVKKMGMNTDAAGMIGLVVKWFVRMDGASERARPHPTACGARLAGGCWLCP